MWIGEGKENLKTIKSKEKILFTPIAEHYLTTLVYLFKCSEYKIGLAWQCLRSRNISMIGLL